MPSNQSQKSQGIIRVLIHPGGYVPPAQRLQNKDAPLRLRVWEYIKQNRLQAYDVRETIVSESKASGTEMCERMKREGFDAAISDLSLTPDRRENVTFTMPFFADEHTLFFPKEDHRIVQILKLFYKKYIPVIVFIIMLSVLMAYLSQLIFKKRESVKDESFFDTIAAMFGSFEYIKYFFNTPENSHLSMGWRAAVSIVILLISTFVLTMLYAFITSTLLTSSKASDMYTPMNMHSKINILCPQGHATGKKMEDFGATVVYHTSPSIQDTVQHFNERAGCDNYTAVACSKSNITDGSLQISSQNFAIDLISFAVNWNRELDLLPLFNDAILELNDGHQTLEWCKQNEANSSPLQCVM